MSEDTRSGTVPAHRSETLAKGSVVTHDGVLYRVEIVADFKTIVATELETGEARALPVAKVKLASDNNAEARARQRPIDGLEDKDWEAAWERLKTIRPLLEMERYGRADVERRAAEVGRTANTLYTWLSRYRTTRDVTTLVPQKRGWPKKKMRITAEAEAVIAKAIKDVYLKKDRRRAIKVVQQVRSICEKRGMEPPTEPTIRARIAKLPEEERMRKRGFSDAADNRFTR